MNTRTLTVLVASIVIGGVLLLGHGPSWVHSSFVKNQLPENQRIDIETLAEAAPLPATIAAPAMVGNKSAALSLAPAQLWAAPKETRGEKLDPKSERYLKSLQAGEKPQRRSGLLPPASLAAFSGLARADKVVLPLFGGEQVTGVINLVQQEADGSFRVGGELTGAQTGTFSLGNGSNQVGGVILLPAQSLAYTLTGQADGSAVLQETTLSEVICFPMPRSENEAAAAAPTTPMEAPPILSSRPGATAVLYLDFDGETVTDSYWNGGKTIVAQPCSLSSAEILEVWNRVKEDYLPFNIDVTTDVSRYNNAPTGRRMRCIITPTCDWYANCAYGGVAYLRSFAQAGQGGFSSTIPCWVFNPGVVGIAEAASHELGHTLGLNHDGRTSPVEEYYYGHGTGAVGWAPIMGVGYNEPLVQWSKGEYLNANNHEDDIAIIANSVNGFGFVTDDAGDSRASATPLNAPGGSVYQTGLIGTTGDADYYALTVPTDGPVTINADPAPNSGLYISRVPNLDIYMELQDGAGAVLASSNPDTELNATVTCDLPAGLYYVKIQGTGRGDVLGDGYSNYGSLGYYTLTGSAGGLVNGSFELGYAGWAASGNQAIAPRASQGTNGVEFNIGQTIPNGVLSQSFTTTPGQSYELVFDVGADWGTATTQQRLEVSLQGASTLLRQTVTVVGSGNASSKYISTNFTFVADSVNTTLTFRDVSPTGMSVDLLLDNVQLFCPGKLQFKSPSCPGCSILVAEDAGSIRVFVSRTGGSFGAASVQFATANGTATQDSDYRGVSGTLNWAPGDTEDKYFDVPILNDTIVEGWEDFSVILTSAVGAALGSPTTNIISIRDDDAVVTVVAKDPLTAEPGAGLMNGPLNVAHSDHTATLLPNGTVLVAGGYGYVGYGGGAISNAEIYSPSLGKWAATSSLLGPRSSHTATLLPDGKVLVAGGYDYDGNNLGGAELYDPAKGTWKSTGSLLFGRSGHQAILFSNGKVLVVGGCLNQSVSGSSPVSSAELYDPATGIWTKTSPLHTARFSHTATLLPDGKVLVTGGTTNREAVYTTGEPGSLSSAELYDPVTETWTATQPLNAARWGHTATLLPNGKVLVAGGKKDAWNFLSSGEIFDPITGTWTYTGECNGARASHTATLLANGRVLVAGGEFLAGHYLSNAELYDPATGTWALTGPLNGIRLGHSSTLLPDGKVLVAGGWGAIDGTTGGMLSSAELYDPRTGTWAGMAIFIFSRTGLIDQPLTVNYTVGGTATPDSDYTSLGGSVTFAAWTSAAAKPVNIIQDTEVEQSETVVLTLAPGSGYAIGPPSNATVTITANQTPTLMNGSFELGLSSWTASGNLAVAPRPSNGTNSIEFNIGQTSPNGVLSQRFATTPGQSYNLAFDVGADWGTLSTAQNLQVILSGNSTLLSKTVTVYGPGDSSSKYISTNVTFIADSSSTLLTFKDISATGMSVDLLLDNVRLSTTANQPPDGTITSPTADATITTGQSVNFTGSGTDPDNNLPLTYLWSFGAGSGLANSTSQNPGSLQFNNPGTFAVTFAVTDALGLTDPTPATRTITVVQPNQAPDSSITAPSGAYVPIATGQSVNFIGSGSDPDNNLPLTYLWTFGTGSGLANSTNQNTGPLQFNNPGSFTVTFTVTDALGLSDPTPANCTILVATPEISVSALPATIPELRGAGPLNIARGGHLATLLPDGRVLVAGGWNIDFEFFSSAELYDPVVGTWTTTGSMDTPRAFSTATLLPNGKVLVAGGSSKYDTLLATTELYDAASGYWKSSGSLSTVRTGHTATLLANGKVLVAGGVGTNTLSTAELYDPVAGKWTTTGSLNVARNGHTATLLTDGKVLVAGGYGTNGPLSSAELYDPVGGSWTATSSLNIARAGHTATLLPSGNVLVAGGYGTNDWPSITELYDPVTGTWTITGSLNTARRGHTATLLPEGTVLVAGGEDNRYTDLSSAEAYDPADGKWITTGSLKTPRAYHSATLLLEGRVLVTGGDPGAYNSSVGMFASSELYSPDAGAWGIVGVFSFSRPWSVGELTVNFTVGGTATADVDYKAIGSSVTFAPSSDREIKVVSVIEDNEVEPSETVIVTLAEGSGYTLRPSWSNATVTITDFTNLPVITVTSTVPTSVELGPGFLNESRYRHTATTLRDGKVLVAGGEGTHGYLSSAEFYDPSSGTWTTTGSLNNSRENQTATLLPNGKVLVAGGYGANNYGGYGQLSSAELYNPATRTWTTMGALNTARVGHTATLLPNGKVLVTGGSETNATELYDPGIGTWTITGSLVTARWVHTATLLRSGKVLVAGGYGPNGRLSSAELYDPITSSWTTTGPLNAARNEHTATLLTSGKVLVAGGYGTNGALSSVEIYDPAAGTWTTTGSLNTARVPLTATLLADGRVLVAEGSSAELYDPVTGTWSTTGSLSSTRWYHTASLLANGNVLVAGGDVYPSTFFSAELWYPSNGTWTETGSFTFSRTGSAIRALTVNFTIGGTATPDVDYTGLGTSVTFPRGATTVAKILNVIDDTQIEPSETVVLTLAAGSGYTLSSPSNSTITITDWEPGSVQFKSATHNAAESVGNLRIYVSRTGGSAGLASVDYATSDGQATAGSDYTAVTGTLHWVDGDSADKYFDVPIIDDSVMEGAESFAVNLSGATGAALGSPSATTVTIPGNDSAAALINGSFEQGYTGWIATGNQAISSRSSDGSAAVQFNSGQVPPNGTLSQNFATTPGQSYNLAFDIGADWGTPSTAQSLQVIVSGDSTLISKTVTVYGPGNSSSKYISTNVTFVANSTSTSLTFKDVSPTGLNVDLLLDNVRVSTLGNQPPDGTITTPSGNGTITLGQSVSFAGSGTDPDNNLPLTYLWSFGAGSGLANSTSQNPGSLQFNNPGTFTVTFTVSDSLGLSDPTPATRTITVQGPSASLVNGSFETGYTGWSATGNQTISGRASDGSKAVQFNSGQAAPNGVLAQSFATAPGQSYTLAFDVGADWGSPSTAQSLRVTLSGNSTLLQKTVTVYGPGDSSSKYTATNFTFVADSGITTLTFLDVSPTGLNIDLLLDHVRITVLNSGAPLVKMVSPPLTHAGIVSIDPAPEGFRIHMAVGQPGTYELQYSRNLNSWNTLATRSVSAQGTCEFVITNASEKMIFYRVLLH